MLVSFRLAALSAATFAGLAGAAAFAQEAATSLPDPVAQEAVELRLTSESQTDGGNAPVYRIQSGNLTIAAADDVAQQAEPAEEPAGLWLGVQLATEIPPALAHHLGDAKGALVETVYPDSPASESGIEAYDLIVKLGKAEVVSNETLIETMKQAVEAKPIDVVVRRGGERKTISVTPRERATAQLEATATAEPSDLLFYNLNVPHMRMLPALGGPDAGTIRHRIVQGQELSLGLPENVKSMRVRIERDGDEVKRHVEVTTADGETLKATNEEELKAFPPEILAALPLPRNHAKLSLRLDAAPGSPAQQRVVIQAVPGLPATNVVPPPQIAVPAPGPIAQPWVDIVTQAHPAQPGQLTYKAVRLHQSGEDLTELKKQISDLRAAVERIEQRLQKDE